jgi:hypothetical protein
MQIPASRCLALTLQLFVLIVIKMANIREQQQIVTLVIWRILMEQQRQVM